MEARFTYVISQFERIYGISDKLDIAYGLENDAIIRIKKAETDLFDRRGVVDPAAVAANEWAGRSIPFLFDSNNSAPIISRDQKGVVINYDIVLSAFYLLSGWHEYASDQRDHLGRFPFEQSIQFKLDMVRVPVVNYYFDILKTAVEQALGISLEVNPWGGAPFATFVSHDIDKVRSGWLEEGLSAVKQGRLISAGKLTARRFLTRDVWFNIDEVLEVDLNHDVRPTFFVLAKQGSVDGVPNADYDIGSRDVQDVLRLVSERGAEIGLHASLGSNESADHILDEMKQLPERPAGVRFHYLKYDPVTTPAVLSKTGIEYDSTLGFAEQPGFRNGICHPFTLYDLDRDEPTNVIEIPLVLMDATLSQYMNVSPDSAPDIARSLIDEIKKFRGCFSVLWHNNYFSPFKYRGWDDAFDRILALCKREGSVFLSGAEVVRHLKKTAEGQA